MPSQKSSPTSRRSPGDAAGCSQPRAAPRPGRATASSSRSTEFTSRGANHKEAGRLTENPLLFKNWVPHPADTPSSEGPAKAGTRPTPAGCPRPWARSLSLKPRTQETILGSSPKSWAAPLNPLSASASPRSVAKPSPTTPPPLCVPPALCPSRAQSPGGAQELSGRLRALSPTAPRFIPSGTKPGRTLPMGPPPPPYTHTNPSPQPRRGLTLRCLSAKGSASQGIARTASCHCCCSCSADTKTISRR